MSKVTEEEIIVPIINCINKCISSSTSPDKLKIADIVPAYK